MIKLRVTEILSEQNKTKYWLAKQTEMDYHALNKLVSNETTSIRFDTLEKLCKVLNVSVGDLFSDI